MAKFTNQFQWNKIKKVEKSNTNKHYDKFKYNYNNNWSGYNNKYWLKFILFIIFTGLYASVIITVFSQPFWDLIVMHLKYKYTRSDNNCLKYTHVQNVLNWIFEYFIIVFSINKTRKKR